MRSESLRAKKQQRLDNLPHADRAGVNLVEHLGIVGRRTLAAAGHLDRTEHAGQRRSQLVRGIAGKTLLPLDRFLHPMRADR